MNEEFRQPMMLIISAKKYKTMKNRMKQILLLLFMAVMVACTPKQNISGVWVNVKYDQKLQETKSPIQAQKSVEYSMVEIDSLASKILLIINMHEGMNEEIKNKGGELSFSLYDGTLMPIKIQNARLLIGDNQFIKIADDNFQQYLNKTTLAGNYQKQNGENVVFKADGTLSGLAEYTNYSVMSDFYGDGTLVNMVLMKGNETEELYAWEIKDKELLLFNVIYGDPQDKTQGSCGNLMVKLKELNQE